MHPIEIKCPSNVNVEVMETKKYIFPLVQEGLEISVKVVVEMDATTRNQNIFKEISRTCCC